ncbi:MAG: hypothetical protein AAGC91_15175, partial [Pseudomonadota bacterium]
WKGPLYRLLTGARILLMERGTWKRHALDPVDATELFAGISEHKLQTECQLDSQSLTDPDLTAIDRSKPDVLLHLGTRRLSGAVLDLARFGCWQYHLADSGVNRGGPPGYWETMESWPATGSELHVLAERLDRVRVLCRSWSCTNVRSLNGNNNSRLWTASSFVPRALRRIARDRRDGKNGSSVFESTCAAEMSSTRVYNEPGIPDLVAGLCRKTVQKLTDYVRYRLYENQWILMYGTGSSLDFEPASFQSIIPPKDRFWADPFVFSRRGKDYVFFEELVYREGTGHISVAEIDQAGMRSQPVTILSEPHHLSYPFLFEHAGELYMLAEAIEKRVVPLYRCEHFPEKWVLERNLLEDLSAVDPTLFFHRGLWYLFVNVAENPGSSEWDELFLYVSDDPIRGNWAPHPCNPVVSDVRLARPAGRILEIDGDLYRPSQDCSHHYGYGLNLNRIVRLDPEHYAEELVRKIEPRWDPKTKAVHTLSMAGNLTVIDAQRRRARYR